MTRLEALEKIERAARLFYIEATAPGWNAGKYTDYRMQLGSALSALPPDEPVGEVVERKIVQISTCFDRGDGYGGGGSSYMPAVVTTALCADGTLWWKHHHDSPWTRHPSIPEVVGEAEG